jgi:hypothetical protein
MESIDYHARRLEKDLERVKRSDINEENKVLILNTCRKVCQRTESHQYQLKCVKNVSR